MRPVDAPDRAPVEHFERLMRESEDPWDYASSAYEQAKYERTLAALPARPGLTLELGCSIGVFTAMLAPRCEHLLAVDFSPSALAQARRLLAGAANVELRQTKLPEQMPTGPFATIVCAEVLYYWSEDLVLDGLARIEAALVPGGTLVAVHWRHGDPRRQLDGNQVHRLLHDHTRLRHREGEQHPDYLLDVWERDER